MDSEWLLKMWVKKFRMCYIINLKNWLNISRRISKSVRRELTFWYNSWNIYQNCLLKCNASRIFLRIFWVIILCNWTLFLESKFQFCWAGCLEKVALLFNGATRRSIVCMLFLCRYFNVMHWIVIGLFFLAPDFINSVILSTVVVWRMNNHSILRHHL